MTNEERNEILDTIRVCEEYIEDARKHAGRGGLLAHIFSPGSVRFAKDQIEFERDRLRTVAEAGSISTGTMNVNDLVPTFLSELDVLRERRSLGPDANPLKHGREDIWLGEIERRVATHGDDYNTTDASAYDLEELFDLLEEFAPAGHYFGSHEGDGADFGFWPLAVD
jgi:hypothetical protein